MNGIPEEQPSQNVEMTEAQAASPLAVLRAHPQFDELRRTIQANPASLQQVLQGLGREDPQLLQTIKDNQAEFLAMMNEPVQDAPAMGSGDDLDAARGGTPPRSVSPPGRPRLRRPRQNSLHRSRSRRSRIVTCSSEGFLPAENKTLSKKYSKDFSLQLY